MKYAYQLATLAVAVLCLAGSCEVIAPLVGPDISRVDTYQERVVYHRGPCYGRCPVYTLRLYDNGLVVYEGEKFTDKPGTWQTTIDRRRADALLDSFERADFKNYPRAFRRQIVDAASIDIDYTSTTGETYVTSFADYAPPELRALDQSLQRLAQLKNYRMVSDSIPGLFTSKSPTVRAQERQMAIIQLAPGTVAENWIVKYGRQNLELKGKIAPNGSYYNISIDPNAMPTEEMLDILRRDEEVLSVQLDKQVSPR